MRRLSILSVAYPLAPVGADAAGGAEQAMYQLDRAIVAAGHRSLVIAMQGSRPVGEFIEAPAARGPFDARARAAAQKAHAIAIERACCRFPIDLVHMHGIDFHTYLPRSALPVLVTLHLPLAWYPQSALRPGRPYTFLHCVSRTQENTAPADVSLLPPIENGVDANLFVPPRRKRGFALFLGRICPEKGVHLAIEAAAMADVPLLIAGEVFPYDEHKRYFESAIAPRLGGRCRFIGRVGVAQKRRLLAQAGCVLIPSLVDETSSLVARESLASGTPVIAFAKGALVEAIDHGRTGYLVANIEEMADRIRNTGNIDPEFCRAEACRRFPLKRMTDAYLRRYQTLAAFPMRAAG